jgi:hypothetical protein
MIIISTLVEHTCWFCIEGVFGSWCFGPLEIICIIGSIDRSHIQLCPLSSNHSSSKTENKFQGEELR